VLLGVNVAGFEVGFGEAGCCLNHDFIKIYKINKIIEYLFLFFFKIIINNDDKDIFLNDKEKISKVVHNQYHQIENEK